MPYRTLDNHIDGLAITFTDISVDKKIEAQLADAYNEETGKQSAELIIANKELIFQNEAKEKRAAELIIANKKLLADYKEIKSLEDELEKVNNLFRKHNIK